MVSPKMLQVIETMAGIKQVLLIGMCCDFPLLYWLSSDRFSYSKTFPAKSSGAPLSARECWVTAEWVSQFNSSSHAISSTAAIWEGRFYKDRAAHTTSSCYSPCMRVMHRNKPMAAYYVYFKFSSFPHSQLKFLYWGLTLTTNFKCSPV